MHPVWLDCFNSLLNKVSTGKTQGKSPGTEWTLSMNSVDIVHGLSGHCPWILVPILQPDNINGQRPLSPSTESMDFLLMGRTSFRDI